MPEDPCPFGSASGADGTPAVLNVAEVLARDTELTRADFPEETLAILCDAKEGAFPEPDTGGGSVVGR